MRLKTERHQGAAERTIKDIGRATGCPLLAQSRHSSLCAFTSTANAADSLRFLQAQEAYAIAYSNRGFAYYNKGQYDRAIANYDKAIKLDPKFAIAYNNRGIAYGQKGDDDRAIADFDTAIKLDPKSADTYYNRGIAYGQKGDYDRAIADFDTAIKLAPKTEVVSSKTASKKSAKKTYS